MTATLPWPGLTRPSAPSRRAGASDLRLLGLDFTNLDVASAATLIAQRSPDAPFAYVVTPNADHLVRLARTPALAPLYQGAWLRLLDSRVVAYAARCLGLATPRVCPGSDLTSALLAAHVRRDDAVTVIGLRPAALVVLTKRYRLARVAHHVPPMGFADDPASFAAARDFAVAHPARFTFLAVGSPRQEQLAAAIAATGHARGVGLCVGASLDFLAGVTPRAPRWMQRTGLEWLHRLAGDPRRLARRYLRDDLAIFHLLWRERSRMSVGRSD